LADASFDHPVGATQRRLLHRSDPELPAPDVVHAARRSSWPKALIRCNSSVDALDAEDEAA
jgi:hypothetical protein